MLDAHSLPAPTLQGAVPRTEGASSAGAAPREHIAARSSTTLLRALRQGTVVLVLASAALAGCQSKDIDGVRRYKTFLEKARPALTAMNRSREELYALENPDLMRARFQDDLLPQIQQLEAAANELSRSDGKPEGKLGAIHDSLCSTLSQYAAGTQKLVDALKKAKSEEQREGAIVAWGEQDNQFGREMAALVEGLSRYLDQLNKQ